MKKLIMIGVPAMLLIIVLFLLNTHDHELKLKIVDEENKPIAGARVDLFRKPYREFTETSEDLTVTTDSNGECSAGYDRAIGIRRIEKEGYYTDENKGYWIENEAPAVPAVISLMRERPRQLMAVQKIRIERQLIQSYEFGLKFMAGSNRPLRHYLASQPGQADLWITLKELPRESGWKIVWEIHLRGLHGWEIAPGPEGEHGPMVRTPLRQTRIEPMREAPREGYAPEFTCRTDNSPRGFYLRQNGGRRYGKLEEFELDFWGADGGYLRFVYSVQMTDTGNRSLNPLTTKDLRDLERQLLLAAEPQTVAMLEACERFDKEKIEELLAAGVSIDVEDAGGKTPLLRAVRRLEPEQVKYLLEKGADPEHEDDGGSRPLREAVGEERPDRMVIVRELLERKVDVNAKDHDGRTPLVWAVICGNRPLVDLLIARGADVNYRWREQDTPDCTLIRLAGMEKHPELIPVLRQAGAKE